MKIVLTVIISLLIVKGYSQNDDSFVDVNFAKLNSLITMIEKKPSQKTTAELVFLKKALVLFENGTSPDAATLSSTEQLVGVQVYCKMQTDVMPNFQLGALRFRQQKEKQTDEQSGDFHKDATYNGLANLSGKAINSAGMFYVITNGEAEKADVKHAVQSYLIANKIPETNDAYKYAKLNKVSEHLYNPLEKTKGKSYIMGGSGFYYIRQNGNYIITIQGYPESSGEDDLELLDRNLGVNDNFINEMVRITIYPINTEKPVFAEFKKSD